MVYSWVVEQLHSERRFHRVRSFTLYQPRQTPTRKFRKPTVKRLKALESELAEWFGKRNRGRWARIVSSDRGGEYWFLVRHGEAFTREESVDGRKETSVCYRPVTSDIVVFAPDESELRVNAGTHSEREEYRRSFGQFLFGNDQFFTKGAKYTLDPLRTDGEAALSCSDITGIKSVKLKQVQIKLGGTPALKHTLDSTDVFAALRVREEEFPEVGTLACAAFHVQFVGRGSARTVVVRPPNVAQYTRDDDGELVMEWLTARGMASAYGVPAHDGTGRPVARD